MSTGQNLPSIGLGNPQLHSQIFQGSSPSQNKSPPIPSYVGGVSQSATPSLNNFSMLYNQGRGVPTVVQPTVVQPYFQKTEDSKLKSDTKVINGFLSVIFIMYSIFVIVIGIWGNSMLSRSCVDTDVRANLRGLLVSGSVSATAFISYTVCKLVCTSETVSDIIGENWFLILAFAVSLANFIMAVQLRNQLSNKQECQDGSFQSFDQVLVFFIIFSALVWISIVFIFGKRLFFHYRSLVTKEGSIGRQRDRQKKEEILSDLSNESQHAQIELQEAKYNASLDQNIAALQNQISSAQSEKESIRSGKTGFGVRSPQLTPMSNFSPYPYQSYSARSEKN